jgi:hypothetical protein
MMWILHIVAVLFFIPALFVTIPFHIIINMNKKDKPKHESFKLT